MWDRGERIIMNRVKLSAVRTPLVLMATAVAVLLILRTGAIERSEITQSAPQHVLKGQGALGDWHTDASGVRRLITPGDMPKPYATRSSDNPSDLAPHPADAWPRVLPGF
jgi:hypothetical protein